MDAAVIQIWAREPVMKIAGERWNAPDRASLRTKHAEQQYNRTSEFRHGDTATTGARPPAHVLTWRTDVPSLQ